MSSGKKPEVRIVLVGKSGSGKSKIGNAILGKNVFEPHPDSSHQSEDYKKETAKVDGRDVTVIYTPSLYGTRESEDEVNEEVKKLKSLVDPGPHAFLVVVQPGLVRKGDEDTVKIIQALLGKEAAGYCMVLLAHEDQKKKDGIEKLIKQCGGRSSVLNPDSDNKTHKSQVQKLLKEIDNMKKPDSGSFYEILEPGPGGTNPGEFIKLAFCYLF